MVSCAGLVKTSHQPLAAMSDEPRSEEISRPIVGIIQNRATRMRKTWTAPLPAFSAIRAPRDGFALPVVPAGIGRSALTGASVVVIGGSPLESGEC